MYRGALFFTDYDVGWMKVALLDSLGQVTAILPFVSDLGGPVDVEADPFQGDLYIINVFGKIDRLRYVGSARQQSVK